MTTSEKIAVMQAFEDGKIIHQRKHVEGAEWKTLDYEPEWNWYDFEYRIKPEEPQKTLIARFEEAIEEVVQEVCDHYCKFAEQYTDQETLLDERCAHCPLVGIL